MGCWPGSSLVVLIKVASESPSESSVGVSPRFVLRARRSGVFRLGRIRKQVDGHFGRLKWNEREQFSCIRGEQKK
jgi:hypothetical protein